MTLKPRVNSERTSSGVHAGNILHVVDVLQYQLGPVVPVTEVHVLPAMHRRRLFQENSSKAICDSEQGKLKEENISSMVWNTRNSGQKHLYQLNWESNVLPPGGTSSVKAQAQTQCQKDLKLARQLIWQWQLAGMSSSMTFMNKQQQNVLALMSQKGAIKSSRSVMTVMCILLRSATRRLFEHPSWRHFHAAILQN